MKKKIILILLMGLLLVNIAYSIPNSKNYIIRTTSADGSILTGTYTYNLTISNSVDCLGGLAGKKIQLTTDSSGIVNITLDNVDIDFATAGNYWLCYYRDNVLKETLKIGSLSYSHRANVSDSLNPLNTYKVNRIDASYLNTTLLNVSEIYINNSDISTIFTTQSYLATLGYYFSEANLTKAGLIKNTSNANLGYLGLTTLNATGKILAGDWTNATITESQISNLNYDTDITNNRTAIESFLGTRINNNITTTNTNINNNFTRLTNDIENSTIFRTYNLGLYLNDTQIYNLITNNKTRMDSDLLNNISVTNTNINTNYTVLDTRITNEVTGLNSDITNNGTEDRIYADTRITNNISTTLTLTSLGNATIVRTEHLENNISALGYNTTVEEQGLWDTLYAGFSYVDNRINNNISSIKYIQNETEVYFNKVIINKTGTAITIEGNKTSYNSNISGNRSWNFGLSDNSFNLDDNGTSRLFIQNNTGNIGIGTTTPSQKLDVSGVITASTEYYLGTTNYSSLFLMPQNISFLHKTINNDTIVRVENLITNITKIDSDIINNNTDAKSYADTRITNNKTEITTDFIDNIDKNVTKIDNAITQNVSNRLTNTTDIVAKNINATFVNATTMSTTNINITNSSGEGSRIWFNGSGICIGSC